MVNHVIGCDIVCALNRLNKSNLMQLLEIKIQSDVLKIANEIDAIVLRG